MGAQVGASRGFQNEPNVVPMIDILLVLLIIFMMQVPLQRKKMDAQLPPVQEQQAQTKNPQQTNQIVLQLNADGGYAINNEPVAFDNLERRLREIYDPRPVKLMFIKTARNRHYQDVIQAMDIARSAGVQVIGFTPPESETGG
jgi:biopolymer transport protein ExbD